MRHGSMKTKSLFILCIIFSALCVISLPDARAQDHPGGITRDAMICSDCHFDGRAVLSHTADFKTRHKFYAAQKKQVCQSCHKESFCADCHANKEEIKPSDKFKDSPERFFPHRGDYITRHKIDGRINPAPCMRCHGRKNNARCKTCHR